MSALCQKRTYAVQQKAVYSITLSSALMARVCAKVIRPRDSARPPVALTNREKNSNRVLSSDRDTPRGRACLASGQQGHAIRDMKSVLHARCLEANAVA